jgi:nitric oxide reductase NorD protein
MAVAADKAPPRDPFARDVAALRSALAGARATLAVCAGLQPLYRRLAGAIRGFRRRSGLPPLEAAIEAVIGAELGDTAPLSEDARLVMAVIDGTADMAALPPAPPSYRLFEPVPLWPERRPAPAPVPPRQRGHEQASADRAAPQGMRKKAERRNASEADRRDSLILHRFETILSWTQFLNINRKVEDDDPDAARRAADDLDSLTLADIGQRPATRLAFDLDMAPEDIDRAAQSGEHLLPEWDFRRGVYHAARCRVLFADAPDAGEHMPAIVSAERRRRIQAVKRRFEALRPKRAVIPRQIDGDEIDMDALIRSLADIRATGEGSDRIYKRTVNAERDLAVATLIDVSRSTEAVVEERPVIEIAREALAAFGHGLQATGDAHAIYAFSSLRADKVFVSRCKSFDEPMSGAVERRINGLKPGFYTRLGAAIRFTAAALKRQGARRRLLLVITDGKPNDIDYYEGRYGVEDTRKAVIEARRLGLAVFAVAIDAKARGYLPHLFGRNGFALLPRAEHLADALPLIYHQLIG